MAPQNPSTLLKFWGPQYWSVWLFFGWMRASVLLPLRWQICVGKCAGRFLSLLVPGKKRTVLKNLEVCFPELSSKERKVLRNNHLESMGAALSETAMGWFGSEKVIRDATRIEGKQHLLDALSKGKGVLLFCGHFTPLEFIYPALRLLCPKLVGMYRPMRNKLMNELMCRGRERSFDKLFSKNNLRTLIKSLAENSAVMYLPDQCYAGKYSTLIPFFDEPAMTSTATSRILEISGATLLPCFHRRCDDSSYVIHIGAPLKNFPSNSPDKDTAKLMKILENYIRESPEQYGWMHQRFKNRPKIYPDIYAPTKPA
jgi:KDO2-lipid IV(A) lauroyltransferase